MQRRKPRSPERTVFSQSYGSVLWLSLAAPSYKPKTQSFFDSRAAVELIQSRFTFTYGVFTCLRNRIMGENAHQGCVHTASHEHTLRDTQVDDKCLERKVSFHAQRVPGPGWHTSVTSKREDK